jgi:phage shock protein A
MSASITAFARLWTIIKSRIGGVPLESERPEEQLGRLVEDLERALHDLQQSVGHALADEKRLEIQLEDHLSCAGEWQSRALHALERGDEDLARAALRKKKEHDARATTLRAAREAQHHATERLKASLQATRRRVGDAQRQYTLLLAQYRAADAARRVQKSLGGAGSSSAALVERLSEKISRLEAEAEAYLEVGSAPRRPGLQQP